MDKNIVLEAKDLIKVYGTTIKNQVLHGLNFKIYEKEFISIIGYSGSGKSTLLNILGALDKPTTGQILFRDEDFGKMGTDEVAEFRNKNLGFIFQFHHLLPEFTALENVMIPNWISRGKVSNEKKEDARELLSLVGMEKYMNNKANNLSGGQQQRVAIARALINQPTIILGDEPTGNLDSESTDQVYGLFRDIHEKLGTTIIIVTHNDHIAAKSDRVIELKDGRINQDYYNKDLNEDEAFEKVAPIYCKICKKEYFVKKPNL